MVATVKMILNRPWTALLAPRLRTHLIMVALALSVSGIRSRA